MSSNTFDAVIERYFAAWNTRDADDRAKAVALAWTEDGTYTDPLSAARGHEELAAVIGSALEKFPGFEFRPAGPVDGHHHIARFSWELVSTADGSAPLAGFDVITLAEDGRIASVYGFLDRVPGA